MDHSQQSQAMIEKKNQTKCLNQWVKIIDPHAAYTFPFAPVGGLQKLVGQEGR